MTSKTGALGPSSSVYVLCNHVALLNDTAKQLLPAELYQLFLNQRTSCQMSPEKKKNLK